MTKHKNYWFAVSLFYFIFLTGTPGNTEVRCPEHATCACAAEEEIGKDIKECTDTGRLGSCSGGLIGDNTVCVTCENGRSWNDATKKCD